MKAFVPSVRLSVLSAMLVLGGCNPPPPPPPPPPEVMVKVRADKLSLRVNETVQLTTVVEKDGAQTDPGTVTYSSSDSTIAEVDPNTGLVTAKGTGNATLAATAQGKSDTLALKVEGGAVHAGQISANETWRAKDNPHFVLSDVQVEGSTHPTLTIEPGVIVRFASGTGMTIGESGGPGSLKAEGTAAAPIQFLADTIAPTKGFWEALTFGAQSGTDSVLRYAKLTHCGADYHVALSTSPCISVTGQDTRPLIADVLIQNSGGSGLELWEGGAFATGSANVSVSDSKGYAIVIEPDSASTLPVGGTLTNNTPNAVRIADGDVRTTQTWPLLKDGTGKNVPYVLKGVVVAGPSAPTLTLRAGTEVRFAHDGYLQVGADEAGALIAEGTESAPIRFVADSPSPGKGFWSSLYFQESRLATTKLNHVVVDHSGGSNHIAGDNAAISIVGDVNGGFIQNTLISNSGACGIRTETTGSYPEFSTDFTTGLGNLFDGNTGAAQCPQ
jgi:hypothetical protein